MINLTIIKDEESWNKAQLRLVSPSVLSGFSMVNAGTLLFPGEEAVAEAALYEEDGESVFYPYIKRLCPYRSDWFDICSAYEFGGFWFSSADEKICNKLVRGFETAFFEHALRSGIVSEFIRINPFCKISGLEWKEYELYQSGQHVIISTQSGEKSIWEEFSSVRRTEIRQTEKNGLRMEFSDDIKTFTEIYYKRLDALKSYRFYYFPETFLDWLEHKIIIYVYDESNVICGSQVWIRDHKTLFYFLSADVPERRPMKPSSFAINKMIKWACESNIETIHLGGGSESLHHFKSLFSPHRITYFVAKRILNQSAYDELVRLHTEANGELLNSGHFPLYRLDTNLSHKIFPNKRRYTATESLL